MRALMVRFLVLGVVASALALVPTSTSVLTAEAAVPVSTVPMAAGVGHTCALRSDQKVLCWGRNDSGQLGNGSTRRSLTPRPAQQAGGVRAVVAGDDHTCVLAADGSVRCWGANGSGQLGNGTTTASPLPVTVAGLGGTVTAIAAGGATTCALLADARVRCWGQGTAGQLGNGGTASSSTPVSVVDLVDVVQVSVGYDHSCATTAAGGVRCWGAGGSGQLGTGTTLAATTPAPVAQLDVALSVTAGTRFSCATMATGTVRCWGANESGQLGDGTTTGRSVPVPVFFLGHPVRSVELGDQHACARGEWKVSCWGDNGAGQLGDGTTTDRLGAVATTLPGSARALSVGSSHSCAMVTVGGGAEGPVCWGGNGNGQLGDGSRANASLAGDVTLGPGAGAIASDGGLVCATGADLSCWGDGIDHGRGEQERPTVLNPELVARSVDLSATHGCAAVDDGGAVCWGANGSGQLGNGTTSSGTSDLVGVFNLEQDLTSIATGAVHTCTSTQAGAAWCWGNGLDGRLGRGSTAGSTVPVPVTGLGTGVAGVAAAGATSCAWTDAGAVSCWGLAANGQLGSGVTASAVPVAISGLDGTVTSVSMGSTHVCALLTSGRVRCWGQGGGRIGNGSSAAATFPTLVSNLSGVKAISAADDHTCAITHVGETWCWGVNANGVLGNGTTATTLVPVKVPVQAVGASRAVAIGAGPFATCTIDVTAAATCWGRLGSLGLLGTGTTTGDRSPQRIGDRTFARPWVDLAGTPSEPLDVVVLPRDSSALVRWSAPLADGGAPISSYRVNVYPEGSGDLLASHVVNGRSFRVPGLTNGTRYGILVAAVNAVGQGFEAGSPSPPTIRSGSLPAFATYAAMVDRTYLDLTGKAPTAAQRTPWVTALDDGSKSQVDLVLALRAGADGTGNVDPATRLYRAFLQRTPDAGGLVFWVNRRRSGAWNLNRTADFFAASSEFKATYGNLTNRAFVTLIYTDVLGRAADPSGVSFWTGRLEGGRATRGSVMVGFSESNEYKTRTRSLVDVAVAHVSLLGRSPSAVEVADWVELQAATGSDVTSLDRLLGSAAYVARAQGGR